MGKYCFIKSLYKVMTRKVGRVLGLIHVLQGLIRRIVQGGDTFTFLKPVIQLLIQFLISFLKNNIQILI